MSSSTIIPTFILLFSGKRKSGKDFVTDLLCKRLGEICSILRLSAPLKHQYAKDNELDYSKLLDASEYKEKFRADMIQWGEDKRQADPGYFCRIVAESQGSDKPIWLISDCRRRSDVEYFQTNYPGRTFSVRVSADNVVRQSRGWVFTPGIDDAESECNLDEGVVFDMVLKNDGDKDELEKCLSDICERVQKKRFN